MTEKGGKHPAVLKKMSDGGAGVQSIAGLILAISKVQKVSLKLKPLQKSL